jgi:hypothetical protein
MKIGLWSDAINFPSLPLMPKQLRILHMKKVEVLIFHLGYIFIDIFVN